MVLEDEFIEPRRRGFVKARRLRRVVSHANEIPSQPLLPPEAAAGAGMGNEMGGVLGSLTRAKARAEYRLRRKRVVNDPAITSLTLMTNCR